MRKFSLLLITLAVFALNANAQTQVKNYYVVSYDLFNTKIFTNVKIVETETYNVWIGVPTATYPIASDSTEVNNEFNPDNIDGAIKGSAANFDVYVESVEHERANPLLIFSPEIYTIEAGIVHYPVVPFLKGIQAVYNSETMEIDDLFLQLMAIKYKTRTN